jgi:hypothetical protein
MTLPLLRRVLGFRPKLAPVTRICAVCDGYGVLSCDYVFDRPSVCTCGHGDPHDELITHAYDCDTVPCPFCQLDGNALENAARGGIVA